MTGPVFRRRRGTGLRRLALALAVTGIVAGVWGAGLASFAARIPDRVPEPDARTDAIVVLTGGSGRLGEGFALLSEGVAEKLYVSGVYRGVEVSQLLRLSQRQPGELDCCVELGHSADDTAGNAAETAAWMARRGYGSLRLVTANYHMPRSLLEFRRAMPGARIVPHPVFPDAVKHERWWEWPGTARLIISEYNKYLAARARHLLALLVGDAVLTRMLAGDEQEDDRP